MAATGRATAPSLAATRWIFSANVSPLGLPGGVAKAITASLAMADRYPDPLCRALREKLAVAEGVPAEWLLCGNGAADLIFRLALAEKPRTALCDGTHLRRVRHGTGNCGLQGGAAFPAGGKRFCGDGRHP